jgi:hypothetical protein
MAPSKRSRRKFAAVATLVTSLTLLFGTGANQPLHASTPQFQPGDLTPQGPFTPWFGSVTSDVALFTQAGQPPTVFPDPNNTNANSGNRAKVYMAIRGGIGDFANACAFGPSGAVGPNGCNGAPTKFDWPTQLCDQVFQAIKSSDVNANNSIIIDGSVKMEKAVGCENPVEGTLTAARSGQCFDFDYLVNPNTVQWNERVDVDIFHVTLTSHYLFTADLQLDLRFELCNNGLVDASNSSIDPLSVNPDYNPDQLPDCFVPNGSGGFTKACGITVTFRNVSVSHKKTSGTIDWIARKGNWRANQQVANGFTSQRLIQDPSTLDGPLQSLNGQLRAGAQKVVDLLHTDPRFTVVLSLNTDPSSAPAAPVGPFPFPTTLIGGINIELRQEQFAKLEVAGSTGCNNVSSASVDIVGHNFTPNVTALVKAHDATRTVPDVGAIVGVNGLGDFDTGSLAINAQTGDRIEAFAADGTRTATGVLDPIQECIP